MPRGTLEVLLVSANGLHNTDFLIGMDPYAILTCRSQEKRSSVASGEGSWPHWNETFLFTISAGVTELNIKILDKDALTKDDFVGEATIPLEGVFVEESIPPISYNVKDHNMTNYGEIKLGLNFTSSSRNTNHRDQTTTTTFATSNIIINEGSKQESSMDQSIIIS